MLYLEVCIIAGGWGGVPILGSLDPIGPYISSYDPHVTPVLAEHAFRETPKFWNNRIISCILCWFASALVLQTQEATIAPDGIAKLKAGYNRE